MRKVLAICQFVISLFFITTSLLLVKQFRHFMHFEYGFNSENIINVQLHGNDHLKVAHAFSSVPGVSTISACNYVPSTGTNNGDPEEHTSELQSLMRTSYAVFCLQKKNKNHRHNINHHQNTHGT